MRPGTSPRKTCTLRNLHVTRCYTTAGEQGSKVVGILWLISLLLMIFNISLTGIFTKQGSTLKNTKIC